MRRESLLLVAVFILHSSEQADTSEWSWSSTSECWLTSRWDGRQLICGAVRATSTSQLRERAFLFARFLIRLSPVESVEADCCRAEVRPFGRDLRRGRDKAFTDSNRE